MKLSGQGITNDMKDVIDQDRLKYTTVECERYVYTVCEANR